MDQQNAPAPLTPPASLAPISPASASAMIAPLTTEQRRDLDAQAAQYARDLMSLPLHSEDFSARAVGLSALGNDEIRRASSVSNDLLNRPARAMSGGIFSSGSAVSKQLLDLRSTIERLDPKSQGDLFAPHKLFGIIPLGPKIRDYFRSYESSQTHLNAILMGLADARDQLLRDDAAIEQEKENLWVLMGRLEQLAYLAKSVADALESGTAQLANTDPERAKVLKTDALFSARQKQQDIATQQAVNVQGYLALDLVRKNNEELIKGVDRATTTTIAALRTAIIVAQALVNEKLVLDQIQALNATTNQVIADTSAMLKQNTGQVFEAAAASTVDLKTLEQAFADTEAAIDEVTQYKTKALASFQQTVATLEPMIAGAKSYVAENAPEATAKP